MDLRTRILSVIHRITNSGALCTSQVAFKIALNLYLRVIHNHSVQLFGTSSDQRHPHMIGHIEREERKENLLFSLSRSMRTME